MSSPLRSDQHKGIIHWQKGLQLLGSDVLFLKSKMRLWVLFVRPKDANFNILS